MMSVIVISGIELCRKEISGVERYIYEVIVRLDRMLQDIKKDELPDIRLCYRKGETIQIPELKRIRTVAIEQRNKRSKTKDILDYARKNQAVLVTMAPRLFLYPRQVITLYDVRPLEKEQYDAFRYVVNFRLIRLWLKLHREIKVVTISKDQKHRIRKLCGISADRISVIGCGWEHMRAQETDESVLGRFGLEKEAYYLSVGSIARHKNYEWLVRAARQHPDRKFVIAGRENALKGGYQLEYNNVPNLILTGYISEAEKKALLENCRVLLHPSKYEGFGMPPMEALASGRPIAVSNVCCLPEIYGKTAQYFDPEEENITLPDEDGIDLKETERVLQKYTWENAAARWLELLKAESGI